MAKSKVLKKSFSLSNPQVLLIVGFVVTFGAIGLWKLLPSSAASQPKTITYTNYRRLSEFNSESVKVVDEVTGFGEPEKVLQLFPGGTLNFDPPGPTFPVDIKTCYVMRAVADEGSKSATVEIGGYGSSRRIKLQPTPYYREYCVDSTTAGGFSFNVKHIDGHGIVNVKHASHYSAIPTEYQIVGHGDNWSCEKLSYFLRCQGSLYVQKPKKPDTAKYVTVTQTTLIEGANLEALRTAQFPLNATLTIHGDQAVMIFVQ